VITRLIGASGRALCVVTLIVLPGLLIPGVPDDSTQFAMLIALFAGVLTVIEYTSPTPVMVEFRDAPPYNKVRYVMLATLVGLLTFALVDANGAMILPFDLYVVAQTLGAWLDVPYSPVRLMTHMLPNTIAPDSFAIMQACAGLAFAASVVMMITVVVYFRFLGWPNRKVAFNVHTNLPMFDPTSGGDVVVRLRRGARINLLVGLTVPFIIPACLQMFGTFFNATGFTNLQNLVWLVALWAFLPLNLCLRGLVMIKLVQLIEAKRRQRYSEIQEDGLLA